MKIWQTIAILALSAAIVVAGWVFRSSDEASPEREGETLVSRKKTDSAANKTASSVKIATQGESVRKGAFEFDVAGDDKSLSLSFGDDFAFEDEIKERLSSVLQGIYDQYLAASKREDRKAMLASIQQMLAKIQAGEKVPVWLKQRMIEGISWIGGSALPEMIAMAADAEIEVSNSALEALQDLLWDFDTTPQQISDAIGQIVKLSTDASVIEPFVFEMSDMSTPLKVSTALTIFDSGNETAIDCLKQSMDFVFDDFDSSVKTREDVVRYGEEHSGDDASATVSGQ